MPVESASELGSPTRRAAVCPARAALEGPGHVTADPRHPGKSGAVPAEQVAVIPPLSDLPGDVEIRQHGGKIPVEEVGVGPILTGFRDRPFLAGLVGEGDGMIQRRHSSRRVHVAGDHPHNGAATGFDDRHSRRRRVGGRRDGVVDRSGGVEAVEHRFRERPPGPQPARAPALVRRGRQRSLAPFDPFPEAAAQRPVEARGRRPWPRRSGPAAGRSTPTPAPPGGHRDGRRFGPGRRDRRGAAAVRPHRSGRRSTRGDGRGCRRPRQRPPGGPGRNDGWCRAGGSARRPSGSRPPGRGTCPPAG